MRRRNQHLLEQLAVGRAAGLSVHEWADRHGVSLATAYRWQALPGFAARVLAHRKILVRQELAELAKHAALRTVTPAGREPVRLLEPVFA